MLLQTGGGFGALALAQLLGPNELFAAPASEAQLTKCFDDVFKKAESYAATVKTGLDQAQAVKEEATK